MDEATLKQKEKFESIWGPEAQGHYRRGSCGQRLVPAFLNIVKIPVAVNDYGSGTGRAAVELVKNGFVVHMFDIAENALEAEARSLLGRGLSFRQACLWDLPHDIEKTLWGFCADVLMTIPEAKIDATLECIQRTCINCFFEIYDWSYKWKNTEYTLTMWSATQWQQKLNEYWRNVEQLFIYGQDPRMVFVAKNI